MSKTLSRRTFLQAIGTGASAIALVSCVPIAPVEPQSSTNVATVADDTSSAQQEDLRVRRSVQSLLESDPDDILGTYERAVNIMKHELPEDSPFHWTRQAEIHCKACPHANWFFLPWHAAYLYYFENICRVLGENDSFTLPYWNWELDRTMPSPFTTLGSSLNDTTRARTSIIRRWNMDKILGSSDFQDFASKPASTQRPPIGSGSFESGPHDLIHGRIGGHMGKFMSPLDPIFWMHHGMIDCCWSDWLSRPGHNNTTDPAWLDYQLFNEFFDIDANQEPISVQLTVREILGLREEYTFDAKVDGTPYPSGTSVAMADASMPEMIRVAFNQARSRENIELNIGQPIIEQIELDGNLLESFLTGDQEQYLALRLEGVENPFASNLYIEVAINPENEAREITFEEPHFVGTVGFFMNASHDGHGHARNYTLDITDEIRALYEQNALTDFADVNIQITAKLHHDDEIDQTSAVTLNSLQLEFQEPTPVSDVARLQMENSDEDPSLYICDCDDEVACTPDS